MIRERELKNEAYFIWTSTFVYDSCLAQTRSNPFGKGMQLSRRPLYYHNTALPSYLVPPVAILNRLTDYSLGEMREKTWSIEPNVESLTNRKHYPKSSLTSVSISCIPLFEDTNSTTQMSPQVSRLQLVPITYACMHLSSDVQCAYRWTCNAGRIHKETSVAS